MASTAPETAKIIAQYCDELVENYFNQRPYEAFELDYFSVPPNALLATLAKPSLRIFRDPSADANLPSLLLHNLPGDIEAHKRTEVYKFIEETNDLCSGLYGTSGAGKTRSIYEYLSHNFGFYFVANTNNDPGSKDLGRLINMFTQDNSYFILSSLDYDDESQSQIELKEKKERRSEGNYSRMDRCVSILIYVRTVIFEAIKRRKPDLTAFDWLLIQLYPKKTLKSDLFSAVYHKCCKFASHHPTDQSVWYALSDKCGEDIYTDDEEDGWPWSVMVVDEAQVLLDQLRDHFLCGKGIKVRTAFSAVLKGMVNVLGYIGSETGYPLVAGTGMKIDDVREAPQSILAKRPHTLRENRRTIFRTFQPLDAGSVKTYLNDFLSLNSEEDGEDDGDRKTSNDCVLDHVAKWLRGRPRWAASFLELYLVHARNCGHDGTRGSFSLTGRLLIQALDRFLLNYTTGMIEDVHRGDGDRRKSYDPPEGTALSCFSRAKDRLDYEVMKQLESCIFKFAVGGQAAYIDTDVATLIEVGVAVLSQRSDLGGAVLDEPIMIQAGLNYFNVEKLDKNNMAQQEKGGQGDAFEKIMLPAIQRNFANILRLQLGDAVHLEGYAVSRLSCYGVLAVDCLNPSETMKWIDDAANSTFEGQTVPFCYPDKEFGPDLAFMLRDAHYIQYLFSISQAKYNKEIKQMDALRTITPSLLYYEKRGKDDETLSRVISSDNDLESTWEKVKPKLVGGSHGCVRFMVQYPCDSTKSAKPGVIEDDQVKVKKSDRPEKAKSKKRVQNDTTTIDEKPPKRLKLEAEAETPVDEKRKLGWLVTIDKNNASTLFDNDGLAMLNALK